MNIILDKWQIKDYIDFYNASNDDDLRNNMNGDVFDKSNLTEAYDDKLCLSIFQNNLITIAA